MNVSRLSFDEDGHAISSSAYLGIPVEAGETFTLDMTRGVTLGNDELVSSSGAHYYPEAEIIAVPLDEDHFPDAAFRAYLSAEWDDGDNLLSTDEIAAIDRINFRDQADYAGSITSLKGIEYFPELTELGVSRLEALSGTLDLSGNPKLEIVSASDCPMLEALTLSNNANLYSLVVNHNVRMTSLTLAAHPSLRVLGAYDTALSELDISACPLLLNLLDDQFYRVEKDAHLYEESPRQDGHNLWYSRSTLLRTRGDQVFSTLTLPASLTRIEEEAFAGIAADVVVLPQGCVSLDSGAFAGCPNLQIVYAPADTAISEHAFDGCGHVYVQRRAA